MEESKIVQDGKYEKIISFQDHFYIVSKKDRLCVLPYTISSEGLLDKIGVIEDYNVLTEKNDYTLMNSYISEDDGTNLVAANRLIYSMLKQNVAIADKWIYLGMVYSNLTSDSCIKLYAVDVSDVEVKDSKEKKFKMLRSSTVVTSDDMLFLAAYLRLFNFFYINSLTKDKNHG